jgi:hypothetical protein
MRSAMLVISRNALINALSELLIWKETAIWHSNTTAPECSYTHMGLDH